MKIRIHIYLSCILIFASSLLYGQEQEIKFMHLTVNDGLTQNWIRSIFQDSYGYMWFGSGGSGINRYDGYEIKLYKNDPFNKNSLSSNWINIIYEDNHRRLWIGTQHGINIYDREKDLFIKYDKIPSEMVIGIYEPSNEYLYICTNHNIYELNNRTNVISPFCESASCFKDIFMGQIEEDTKGNFWIPSTNGLFRLDFKNKTLIRYPIDDKNPLNISANSLQGIYKDKSGRVWVGSDNKGLLLICYDENDTPFFKKFTNDPNNKNSISPGLIRALLDDGTGRLWIGTENGGLDILDLKNIEKDKPYFRHFKSDIDDVNSISNNSIYSIFKDKQDIIWIGTYSGGINYYSKQLFKFEHYYKNINNHLIDKTVNAFYYEGDQLWIGTEGGLSISNSKTGKYQNFCYDKNDSKTIGSNSIWTIFKDSRDNVWVGTWGGGLNLFDKKSSSFKRYLNNPNDSSSISGNNVFSITEDDEGYIWIATMGFGLNKYDYKTNKFKSYKSDFYSDNTISGDWVQCLLNYGEDELWISTSDGVDILNKKTLKYTNFKHDTSDYKSISYNGANMIFKDSKNNIWLGTDGGLNFFNRRDSSFKYYTEKDGLANNSIKGIVEDYKGNLWISTNNGVSKFINGTSLPDKPTFKNYTKKDGLQGNEFSRRACFKDPSGKIYFGGLNGFNSFYPDSINDNQFIPEIVFTDFLISNKTVSINDNSSPLKKHISQSDEIILKPEMSVITFKYAALNYIMPDKNQYAYKLEGFDKDWNFIGNKRDVTFTNLAPGNYIFKVKACNNDGYWNEKGTQIKIKVLPPWWKTTWFKITSVLLLLAVLFSIYNFRINSIKKTNIRLKKLVDERTKEINQKNTILIQKSEELSTTVELLKERQILVENQAEKLKAQKEELTRYNHDLNELNATKDKFFSIVAHDIKNPFNVILGFSEILLMYYHEWSEERKLETIKLLNNSSRSLYDLLENLLQWSRSERGLIEINPSNIILYESIKNIVELLKYSANSKEIEIKTNNIENNIIVFADIQLLNSILRNLVNNAIKFTNKRGLIEIKSEVKNGFAFVSVEDNGVGMTEKAMENLFKLNVNQTTTGTNNEKGTGLGLILVKEFVTKQGGEIFVESEPGKGSRFTFTIPLENNLS